MIQVMIFWVMTPHSTAVGYQCFRGPNYLIFTVSYHITTQCQPRRPWLESSSPQNLKSHKQKQES